jgi:hypothetical protein
LWINSQLFAHDEILPPDMFPVNRIEYLSTITAPNGHKSVFVRLNIWFDHRLDHPMEINGFAIGLQEFGIGNDRRVFRNNERDSSGENAVTEGGNAQCKENQKAEATETTSTPATPAASPFSLSIFHFGIEAAVLIGKFKDTVV